jgi:PrgI family protein
VSDDHDSGWVRIPADIDRADTVVGRLTARQVIILGIAAAAGWVLFMALHSVLPLWALAALALPAAGTAGALAFSRRDGLPLDRFAAAAARHLAAPKRLVHAPEGISPVPDWVAVPGQPLPAPLTLPATAVTDGGVVQLGRDGAAVLIACSTVSFALRTPAEQDALTAAFARLLNSLTVPVQILVRAEPLDLRPAVAALRQAAPGLPHPALEQAALDHAAFLQDLAATRDLLARQVIVAVREPAGRDHGDGAAGRARRRAEELLRHLAATGIPARILDGPAATAVLAAAVSPGSQPPAPLAAPGQVITAREDQ